MGCGAGDESFLFRIEPQLRGLQAGDAFKRLYRRCAAHTKRPCALASVVENEQGAVLVLQIVQAPAPCAALAEAGLRDERFFSHRVDEPVARERTVRRKAELKAVLRCVQNVFPRRAVDELGGRENNGPAAV